MADLTPHRFQVALHDTDVAGVQFFAHLFRHAHDAYERAMADLGWPLDCLIRHAELGLPIVHAEADFCLPLRHGDQVEVLLQLKDRSSRRFTLDYHFQRDTDRVATARSVHVAIDPGTGQSRALPEGLVEALERLRPAE